MLVETVSAFKLAQEQKKTVPESHNIDTDLIWAAKSGDRSAFGELYQRYSRMVHGILLARIPRSDVDDLVQDVFLYALRSLHHLREQSSFGGWLAMIARNRAIDYLRQSRNTTEITETTLVTNAADAAAIGVLDQIRLLPEAYRETLIMRLVEGMTGPEIAERTGMSQESVRVNLHRGMKMLREKLGREA